MSQTKARLWIEYPWGHTITKTMTPEQRLDMLRSSVAIIRSTHTLHMHEHMADWLWFFRGFVQWHALAIVVAELAHSTSPRFARSAWAVLEPLLQFWEQVYETKHGDAPWDHVNSLIQRSRDAYRLNTKARSLPIAAQPNSANPIAAQEESQRGQSHRNVDHNQLRTNYIHATPTFSLQQSGAQNHEMPSMGDHGVSTERHSINDPYPDLADQYSCASGLAGFDIDIGSFDFDLFPESVDFDALNAVFASQDWEMAQPMGTFDIDAVY